MTRDTATRLGSVIMIAVATIAALVVSALQCAWLVGWNLTRFG
jgi:hypothetical protein